MKLSILLRESVFLRHLLVTEVCFLVNEVWWKVAP